MQIICLTSSNFPFYERGKGKENQVYIYGAMWRRSVYTETTSSYGDSQTLVLRSTILDEKGSLIVSQGLLTEVMNGWELTADTLFQAIGDAAVQFSYFYCEINLVDPGIVYTNL